VDAVINHMCYSTSGPGTGSAGSYYDAGAQQFPGVPFGPTDFNCCNCQHRCLTSSCNIDNYADAQQVRTYTLINVKKKLPQKFDIFVRVEMAHLKRQKLLC